MGYLIRLPEPCMTLRILARIKQPAFARAFARSPGVPRTSTLNHPAKIIAYTERSPLAMEVPNPTSEMCHETPGPDDDFAHPKHQY
jgi:hypothetical protein